MFKLTWFFLFYSPFLSRDLFKVRLAGKCYVKRFMTNIRTLPRAEVEFYVVVTVTFCCLVIS